MITTYDYRKTSSKNDQSTFAHDNNNVYVGTNSQYSMWISLSMKTQLKVNIQNYKCEFTVRNKHSPFQVWIHTCNCEFKTC